MIQPCCQLPVARRPLPIDIMGGDVHTIACPVCGSHTVYETGGDEYTREYGFQGFNCDCPQKEHAECARLLESQPARVSMEDGLPVFRFDQPEGVLTIRSCFYDVDLGLDSKLLLYFEGSALQRQPPEVHHEARL
ncbi:MAG: hypothetical protein ACYCOU_02660 [Sulfobacillus sp.]